jgi:predicted P-type ATPase
VSETEFDASQRFIGDPLEIELVKTAGWRLHEPTSNPQALPPVLQDALASLPNDVTGFSLMLRPSEHVQQDDTGAGLAVIKEYAFSSQQQRMTVLVAPIGQRSSSTDTTPPVALAFVKGAPERVVALCTPESLPADFEHILDGLTNDGLRVLAIAGGTVKAESWQAARLLNRDQVETNMTFLGLVVFENRVKPESAPVLEQLHQAHIRTLMITGDNIKTACSVAHTSGMVPKAADFLFACTQTNKSGVSRLGLRPNRGNMALASTTYPYGLYHVKFPPLVRDDSPSLWLPKHRQDVALAITGAEFAKLRAADFDAYQRFIVSATVFARMGPDQKSQLIEDLIDLDYCVGMCGDGANDCGALKAAHVGISLSEAEASVAAPFTSSVPNISCVVTLIREGRAALVTSFSCFKFMALYSFIEFTTALILYWINSNLGDFQYLYIDLVLILTLALFMADSDASPTLHHRRPPGSLVSPTILVSIVGQIALHVGAQVVILELIKSQPWFVPLVPDPDVANILCFENTGVFLFSTFQYVAVAIAFTLGRPYRAPVSSNHWFVISAVLLLALNAVFVLTPTPFMRDTLQLLALPGRNFALMLVGLAVGVGVLSYGIERGSANNVRVRSFIKAIFRKRHYKNKYKVLARDVLTSDWMMGLYFAQHEEDGAPAILDEE